MVLVSGEITSDCYVDIPAVVRDTIEKIGYVGERSGGFDAKTCAVLTSIDEQSCDIAGGVNKAYESRSNNADTSVSETENIPLLRTYKTLSKGVTLNNSVPPETSVPRYPDFSSYLSARSRFVTDFTSTVLMLVILVIRFMLSGGSFFSIPSSHEIA